MRAPCRFQQPSYPTEGRSATHQLQQPLERLLAPGQSPLSGTVRHHSMQVTLATHLLATTSHVGLHANSEGATQAGLLAIFVIPSTSIQM